MKNAIVFLIIIILFSCQEKTEGNNWNELTVAQIDSLNANGKLTKKFYPNMSGCGGALNGFYYKDKLVFIDATYSGELSYTRKKMYLNNLEFSKIIYQEHYPEMEKYKGKYPLKKYEFDPSKVTFADTIYEIEIGKKIGFKKTFENKILSTELDSTLLNKLIDCGNQMTKELESLNE